MPFLDYELSYCVETLIYFVVCIPKKSKIKKFLNVKKHLKIQFSYEFCINHEFISDFQQYANFLIIIIK
jgi:hypothetical protein